MAKPPTKKYLIYAILLSVLFILAIILYQHLIIFRRTTTADISKYLKDFTVTYYEYENGEYTIYLVPTSRVSILNLTVNKEAFENFTRVFEKDTRLILEGEAEGDIKIEVKYKTTGLEHTGYAIIPE